MSDLRALLAEYIDAHAAGGDDADPSALLDRTDTPTERAVLVAMIDEYLREAPLPEFDRAAFDGSRAAALTESLGKSLAGQAGLWPSLLPRLRNRAQIRRADLVGELSQRLGAQEEREKVGHYYHQMEQGLLPSAGVSDRVLEALGAIVGQTARTLREAGRALGGGAAADPSPAFTRTTESVTGEPADLAPETLAPAEDESWDEVDRLFRAG